MTAPDAAPYCLIVDDEPRLRQVMVHLMRGDGFQCIEAGNGIEALEQLEQVPGHARAERSPDAEDGRLRAAAGDSRIGFPTSPS